MSHVFAILQFLTALMCGASAGTYARSGQYEFAAVQGICAVLMIGLLLKGPK